MSFFKKETHVRFNIGDNEYDLNLTRIGNKAKEVLSGAVEKIADYANRVSAEIDEDKPPRQNP